MGIEIDTSSGYWEDSEINAFAVQSRKKEDAPVMVFLKSVHDSSRAHQFRYLTPFLKSACKTCELFGIAVKSADEVGRAIQHSARKFEGRWIILVLCGHGDSSLGMAFEDGFYGPKQVRAEHYVGIKGVIALSCDSEHLAKQIAKVTGLPTFGTKGEIYAIRALFYQNRPICLDAKGRNLFYYFSSNGASSGDEFYSLEDIEQFVQGEDEIWKRFLLEFYSFTTQHEKAVALAETMPEGTCDAREYILGCDALSRSDLDQAEHYFKEARRLGSPNAPIRLGNTFLKKGKYPEAFFYFEQAASYSGLAQYYCGYCYKHGLGVEQSDEKAFDCFESAANSGEIKALYQLGKAYLKGCGITPRKHLAASYFSKFIDKKIEEIGPDGDLDLLFKKDHCFVDSLKKLQALADEGNSEALFCFGKVAASRTLAEAAIKFGVFYDEEERLAKAEDYYIQAMKKGHEEAPLCLLQLYCVQIRDLEKAKNLCREELANREETQQLLVELSRGSSPIASQVLEEVEAIA